MRDEERGNEREPPAFRPRAAFDFDQMKSLVQKYFKVYEAERDVRGFAGQEISAFYVQVTDPSQFAERFDQLRAEVRAVDPNLMVVLQYSGGEDIILIAKKPPVFERSSGLNLVLFVATLLTTTLAGAMFYAAYEHAEDWHRWLGADITYLDPRFLALGFLSFSLPVMAILGIHELGHFFVAKRHHVRTSLPYFIPVPPIVPIGTFGAFIAIREPIPDRKALFDIGASGPIAGFVATIPVLVIGLLLTSLVASPVPPEDEVHIHLVAPDGHVFLANGTWPNATASQRTIERGARDDYVETINVSAANPHWSVVSNWTFRIVPLHLGEPATVKPSVQWTLANGSIQRPPLASSGGNATTEFRLENATSTAAFSLQAPENATGLEVKLEWRLPPRNVMRLGNSLLFLAADALLPIREDVYIHPTGFAGWVGLLVTGFNLLPAGQLDGGHVARAALGERQRWASFGSIGAMIVLSWFFSGWLVMALLLTFLGLRHPPPLNDKVPLDGRRKVVALLVLAILVVCFIPIPFES